MKYNIIIISTYLLQALLQSPNSAELCSCQEYTRQVCDKVSKCSWNQNNQNCENLICQNRNSTYCYGSYSDYKCKWDQKQNKCIDFETTKCEEINNSKDCQSFSKEKCLWTIIGNCERQQDCLNDFDCPFDQCSFQNGICSDPKIELNCTATLIDQCDYTRNGKGLYCFINDDGQCKQYNLATQNCSQWSDNQFGCNSSECNYVNKTCIEQTCQDKNEENCHQPSCFWIDNQCQDYQNVDLTLVQKNDCQKQSTYFWSKNEKCEKCNRQIIEQEESQDIDLIIGLSISIPFLLSLIAFGIWKYRERIQDCLRTPQSRYEIQLTNKARLMKQNYAKLYNFRYNTFYNQHLFKLLIIKQETLFNNLYFRKVMRVDFQIMGVCMSLTMNVIMQTRYNYEILIIFFKFLIQNYFVSTNQKIQSKNKSSHISKQLSLKAIIKNKKKPEIQIIVKKDLIQYKLQIFEKIRFFMRLLTFFRNPRIIHRIFKNFNKARLKLYYQKQSQIQNNFSYRFKNLLNDSSNKYVKIKLDCFIKDHLVLFPVLNAHGLKKKFNICLFDIHIHH